MTVLSVLIYALATWRVTSLLVNEAGPGDVFLHLREFAGIEHDDEKEMTIIPDTFFAGVLSCIWCASLYVGAFWIILDWVVPFVAIRLGAIFAVSAATIWVEGRITPST